MLYVRPTNWNVNDNGNIFFYGISSEMERVVVTFKAPNSYTINSNVDRMTSTFMPDYITDVTDVTDSRYITMLNPKHTPDNEKSNRYGLLASFWSASKCKPYDWIYISKVKELKTHEYVGVNHAYSALYYDISPSSVRHFGNVNDYISKMYWDIEVYSSDGQFPDSNKLEDTIFLISVVHSVGDYVYGYLLHLGNIPDNNYDIPTSHVKCEDERELIYKFLSLYRRLNVDRALSYNGETFDMTYIANRIRLLDLIEDLPDVSKCQAGLEFYEESVMGMFKPEDVMKLTAYGVDQIDILKYAKLYLPYLPNYKLDTVGKTYIDSGKTGLSIDMMMKYYRDQDVDGMKLVAEYSMYDSILLYKLDKHLNICNNLEELSNISGITVDEALGLSINSIVDRLAYNISANSSIIPNRRVSSFNMKNTKFGTYKNVVLYDYSHLYPMLMLKSRDELAIKLAQRLTSSKISIPELLYSTFHSKYVDSSMIITMRDVIRNILANVNVVDFGEYYFKVAYNNLPQIKFPKWVAGVKWYPNYLQVTNTSYVYYENGELVKVGYSLITKKSFKLLDTYIDNKILNMFGISEIPDVPTVTLQTPLCDIIRTDTIRSLSNYSSNTWRRKLAMVYIINHEPITTWVKVEYVMTTEGAKLLEDYDPIIDTVDISHYNIAINTVVNKLNELS